MRTETPTRAAESRAATAATRAMNVIARAPSADVAIARIRELFVGHGLPWGPATGLAVGLQPHITRGLLAGQDARTQSRTPTASAQRAEHVLSVALQGAAERPDTAAEVLIAAVMIATGTDHPTATGVAAAILAAIDQHRTGVAQ